MKSEKITASKLIRIDDLFTECIVSRLKLEGYAIPDFDDGCITELEGFDEKDNYKDIKDIKDALANAILIKIITGMENDSLRIVLSKEIYLESLSYTKSYSKLRGNFCERLDLDQKGAGGLMLCNYSYRGISLSVSNLTGFVGKHFSEYINCELDCDPCYNSRKNLRLVNDITNRLIACVNESAKGSFKPVHGSLESKA